MEKKRMPLQHKIIFGYIILVAVIGSMIAILIYERRQMREVEGGVARLWRMYEDIYTTHRHVTGLALQGEAAAGWSLSLIHISEPRDTERSRMPSSA